jgi:mono/diheme cytochrome c family protein
VKAFGFGLLATLALLQSPPIVSAGPTVPGLSNKHPLSEAEVGHLLLGELRCVACHSGKAIARATTTRVSPNLADVGSRVAPDYLRRFIASPSAAHAGTTMPNLLAAEPADQREAIAEALTHYLISQSPRPFARRPVGEQNPAEGQALFHSVGCVACHSPRDDGGQEITPDGVTGLGHVAGKYGLASLGDFLYQPHHARPSGRMPDMKLTPAEAAAVAGYLLDKAARKADAKAAPFQPQAKLVALGKGHFLRLNCVACHTLGGVPAAAPTRTLDGADATRGCLADQPGKAPRFDLTDGQRQAVRAALAPKAAPLSDKARLAATLTAFNCIACHVRDDYGGVSEELNEHFRTSEKDLGDDGRIPPPLTLVGAKLQPVTLKKVLYDGEAVRPYMATRMPQYGEPNLRHLPDLFARLDRVKPFAFTPPVEGGSQKDQARERTLRAAGRELVGDKGLGCIACHPFNGKKANRDGIDLTIVTQRLQPSWFYHFVKDPNAFRPRIVMPTSWPGGKAVHRTILAGDTDQQIEAIWYYLSLGTSAQDPSGISTPGTVLSVTNAARTYRGRSSVAGYRGIAVGFPEKLNYAFNAETGTLSAVWRGEFVRVDRGGQGSGGFSPVGRSVGLAQDVSFLALKDETAPWPLRPAMTKQAPVNPDPMYPKNVGYQFKGYHTDDDSVPTFMYRTGSVAVEDRSIPDKSAPNPRLVRTLVFDSPDAQTIWFRALTGAVEAGSKGQFETAQLRVAVPPVPTVLRPTAADPKATEVLLKFELPKGQSTHTVTYEILP